MLKNSIKCWGDGVWPSETSGSDVGEDDCVNPERAGELAGRWRLIGRQQLVEP